MPSYRRILIPGRTYFFTVVTHDRRPILTSDLGRACLRSAILKERARRPFEIIAMVLLPDHIHAVWALPEGDADYSCRWAKIKENFTREFSAKANMLDDSRSESRLRHREADVWQRRFWEHAIRDEDDLKRCVDYLHWNPVKHGLVERVGDYPWSSYHRFLHAGEYEADWGQKDPSPDMLEAGWE